jgi:hypothetical protein
MNKPDKYDLCKMYQIHDEVSASPLHIHGSYKPSEGLIIPELTGIDSSLWMGAIFFLIIIFVAIVSIILPFETGILADSEIWINESFFQKYWMMFAVFVIYFIPIIWGCKRFCNIRYFYIRDGKATLIGRKCGRRVYDVNDLIFLLIHDIHDELFLSGMSIAFPDPTLDIYERIIIIEYATCVKTLEGIAATLLPLIKGDDTPYHQSKRRPYAGLPKENGWDLLGRYLNLVEHRNLWVMRYKLNDLLFYIVHGSHKKIFEREARQVTDTLIEYKGVNHYE